MTDYTELANRLRKRGERINKFGSPFFTEATANDMIAAADAIEELVASVEGYKASTYVQFIEHGHYTEMKFIPKWIPVTERLPEATGHKMYWVIVRSKYPENKEMFGQVAEYEARFGHPFWDVAQSEYVTHWMPLPEPPKEETE